MNVEEILKKLHEYERTIDYIANELKTNANELGFKITEFSLKLGNDIITRAMARHNEVVKRINIKGYISPMDLEELYISEKMRKYGLYTTLGGMLIAGIISLAVWIYTEYRKSQVRDRILKLIEQELENFQRKKEDLRFIKSILAQNYENVLKFSKLYGKSKDTNSIKLFEQSLEQLKIFTENIMKVDYVEEIYEQLSKFNKEKSIYESLKELLESLNETKQMYYFKTLQVWVSTLNELVESFKYESPFYDKGIPVGIIYIIENEKKLLPEKVSIPNLKSIKKSILSDMLKDVLLLKSNKYISEENAPRFLKKWRNLIYTIYGILAILIIFIVFKLF